MKKILKISILVLICFFIATTKTNADKELSIKINNIEKDQDKLIVKHVLDKDNCRTGDHLTTLYAKWNKINNQKTVGKRLYLLY